MKLDENLPAELVTVLNGLGHDAETVAAEGLAGSSDPRLWEHVQREGRFLVTRDLDFSDIRLFPPGKHHGILILRLRDPWFATILARVAELFEEERIDTWPGALVVATDAKVRTILPGPD